MKINWKARFKNKVFLVTFITLILALIYQILGMFGIVPSISEDMVKNVILMVVDVLATIGVVTDPTTSGLQDSERAMTYCTDCDVRLSEEDNNNEDY